MKCLLFILTIFLLAIRAQAQDIINLKKIKLEINISHIENKRVFYHMSTDSLRKYLYRLKLSRIKSFNSEILESHFKLQQIPKKYKRNGQILMHKNYLGLIAQTDGFAFGMKSEHFLTNKNVGFEFSLSVGGDSFAHHNLVLNSTETTVADGLLLPYFFSLDRAFSYYDFFNLIPRWKTGFQSNFYFTPNYNSLRLFLSSGIYVGKVQYPNYHAEAIYSHTKDNKDIYRVINYITNDISSSLLADIGFGISFSHNRLLMKVSSHLVHKSLKLNFSSLHITDKYGVKSSVEQQIGFNNFMGFSLNGSLAFSLSKN